MTAPTDFGQARFNLASWGLTPHLFSSRLTLLPRVRADIARIRARFPETEFAVVSHGREEFALQSRYRQEYESLHDQVRSLVSDDIPVHVCETHASWYGVTAEDFPDYVDVAPTGPGQVAVYREMGYEVIFVD